jgi:GAF domain-containing protein/ActR/RegA family two-component response regulator
MTPHGKAYRFESLARLARVVTASLELPEVLDSVVRAATDLLPDSSARIWVVEGERLVLKAEAGILGPPRPGRRTTFAFGEGLIGHVAATGRPLIVENVLSDPRVLNVEWMRQAGYVSHLGIPLLVRGGLVGVLALLTRQAHQFTDEELEVLTSFGAQAAIAIENARLYAETTSRLKEMETLLAVGQALSLNLDTQEAMRRVAREVGRALEADMVGAYFLDPRREVLIPMAGYHVPKDLIKTFLDTPFPIAKLPLLQESWRTRKPVWSCDATSDPRWFGGEWRLPAPPHSMLFAPTLVRGEIVGGLFLVWWMPGRTFPSGDLRLIEGVASQVGLALENAELVRQTQEKLRQTETLLSVSRALSSTLHLEQLLRHFLRQVSRTIDADSVGAWLADPATGEIKPVVGYHVPKRLLDPLRNMRLDPQGSAFYSEGFASRRVMVSSDVPGDARIPEAIKRAAPHRAQLFAPIVAQDRAIGAFIAVWWERTREFSQGELALVEAMGSQVAVGLENARLFQENQRKVEELSVLYELSRAVTGQLDTERLLPAIHQQVGRVLDARNMVILLYDEGPREFEVALRMIDSRLDRSVPLRYPSGRCLIGRVLENRRAMRTANYAETCRLEDVEPSPISLRWPYWLGAPMIAGDEPVGGLVLRSDIRPFAEADERLLTNIASLAALAVRSARLFEERERAYGELAAAQDQLIRTEKLRALGEMATGVAHNFNNLLTPVLGWAQLLLKTVDDPKLRNWLQAIEQAATDGARTVQRIQEFSRVRRDQPFVPVDLNRVIQESLELTQPRWREEAQSRGAAIQTVTALRPVPSVAGDPVELREAIINLILNAVDAMPRGGTLTLTTEEAQDRALVTVSDTGVGMSDQVKRRLFDPFFTTKGPSGTGLGLSMTYGIVSRHGGVIWVESAEGKGSTFRLSFPIGQVAEGRAPSDQAPPEPALRCLVVDDQAQVREVLRDILTVAGHQAVLESDGAEAIARFRAEPFDLVLVDLAMPGLNGFQVARAIKEHDPTVPILMITGWGVELSPEELEAHGVDRVLSKPLRLDDVLAAVAACGEHRRGREGLR